MMVQGAKNAAPFLEKIVRLATLGLVENPHCIVSVQAHASWLTEEVREVAVLVFLMLTQYNVGQWKSFGEDSQLGFLSHHDSQVFVVFTL